MSVLTRSFKQTNGYFVVPTAQPSTLLLKVSVPASGSGGDAKPPTFAVATGLPASVFTVSGSLTANVNAGTLLKDMGKTVVSSSRVFRKVQAVSSLPVADGSDACYIELQTGVNVRPSGTLLTVAYLPGLM